MLKRILEIIAPRRCVLCLCSVKTTTDRNLDLCQQCEKDLSLITTACLQCGIPLTLSQTTSHHNPLCGQCLKKTPAFDQVISLYHYQQPLVWLIQQMKFHKKKLIANLLGKLIAHHMLLKYKTNDLVLPQAIIPVPLHPSRQYERGFNQAEELARQIAKDLNCSLDIRLISRNLNNPKQSGLDARQRKKNVKGIFKLNKNQKNYQHIAIVDDVMSTGSTVNEVSKLLKKAGVERIDIWILARASHH